MASPSLFHFQSESVPGNVGQHPFTFGPDCPAKKKCLKTGDIHPDFMKRFIADKKSLKDVIRFLSGSKKAVVHGM
jgi:hypothetical protein